MKYRQLNAEERSALAALRTLGLSRAEIARQLGRHRSTVGRELRRNSAPYDGGYRCGLNQRVLEFDEPVKFVDRVARLVLDSDRVFHGVVATPNDPKLSDPASSGIRCSAWLGVAEFILTRK